MPLLFTWDCLVEMPREERNRVHSGRVKINWSGGLGFWAHGLNMG
jgi:hypothetical protein